MGKATRRPQPLADSGKGQRALYTRAVPTCVGVVFPFFGICLPFLPLYISIDTLTLSSPQMGCVVTEHTYTGVYVPLSAPDVWHGRVDRRGGVSRREHDLQGLSEGIHFSWSTDGCLGQNRSVPSFGGSANTFRSLLSVQCAMYVQTITLMSISYPIAAVPEFQKKYSVYCASLAANLLSNG